MSSIRQRITRQCLLVGCLTGLALGASAASAQNLLQNPDFDADVAFENWIPFNNAYNEVYTFAHSGTGAAKFFGCWCSPYNVSGCFQEVPAVAGETFRVTGWWYTLDSDQISGTNWTVMNVEWHDSSDNLISYNSQYCIDATTPVDTWIQFRATWTAPAGTAYARYVPLFIQPAYDGGSAFTDDVELVALPACSGDLNEDGQVDDSDFVIFAAAYNILACSDPTMQAGCPADLNNDGVVDDADFVLFAAAYNQLICP
jgi:hypothetical protein